MHYRGGYRAPEIRVFTVPVSLLSQAAPDAKGQLTLKPEPWKLQHRMMLPTDVR